MLWMKLPRTISLRDACSPSSRPLKQPHRGEMCFWLAAFFSPPLLTPQDLLRAAPTTIQPHTHQLNLLPVYQSINYLCIDGGWVKTNHTVCYVEPGHFLNLMIWIKKGLNTRKRESHLSQNGNEKPEGHLYRWTNPPLAMSLRFHNCNWPMNALVF